MKDSLEIATLFLGARAPLEIANLSLSLSLYLGEYLDGCREYRREIRGVNIELIITLKVGLEWATVPWTGGAATV